MLDLSSIHVVDNHCHPVLLKQEMDALRFRSYFTEATHPSFAQTHLPNTVYYLWMLRQLAAFYSCDCSEEAIIATRNSIPADVLINRLVQAANVDTLILDIAYPLPEMCYEAEHIGLAGQCRIAAGLDGIEQSIDPGEPQEIDPGNYSDKERERRGIRRLPTSLDEACDALEHDQVLLDALGPLLATSFIAVKRNEAAFFKDKSPEEEALQHFYKY